MKSVIRLSLAFFLLASITVSNAQNGSDVIMTIGDENVTLEDFESIFRKNNNDTAVTAESLDEYMELFINFKLKVKEARALGMDTISAFVQELEGYRKQLARPYLTDGEMLDQLVKDAYERQKEEVRASHLLITCKANADPQDTLAAWNKIDKLRKEILSGKDFTEVAREKSDDPSVRDNGGDLGYFSAFQMVYPFEDAAYTTPVGDVSNIVRTRYGYHILKVTDRRVARGEIKVAHILVRLKADDPTQEVTASKKINDVYEQLKKGASFPEMASKFSEDASSARNGGELPWFSTGKMVVEFEDVAFSLKNNGDFSEPLKTQYGYHIIQRVDFRGIPEFDKAEHDLQNKVRRDSRSEVTQSSFIKKLKVEYGYALNTKSLKPITKVLDTAIYSGRIPVKNMTKLDKPMITLDGKTYSAKLFYNYLISNGSRNKKQSPQEIYDNLLAEYCDNLVLDYEDAKLESKHRDFRLLMNEYRDGILLFELTDEKVWSKAVKDTVGLMEFYENNSDKFMWPQRLFVDLYACDNEVIAGTVDKLLKKGMEKDAIAEKVNKESQLNVQIDSGTFSRGERAVLNEIKWETGIQGPVDYNNQFFFVNVKEVLESQPKSIDEARGTITAEYQNHLEQEWISELRGKYPYTVNQDVLHSLVQ
jgi:peptidyl-prolyl cis-trans isomerase SurA